MMMMRGNTIFLIERRGKLCLDPITFLRTVKAGVDARLCICKTERIMHYVVVDSQSTKAIDRILSDGCLADKISSPSL